VGVVGDFEHLVPDVMLNAVEEALGQEDDRAGHSPAELHQPGL